MGRPFIQLINLTKSYGSFLALSNLNLEIEKGEFVTLLGPSGSGKTTAIQMIAGYISPSDGQILLDGQDITLLPPQKRKMGMVFQNYALFPHMNVWQNVAFGLQMRKVPKSEMNKRVEEVLELVHLRTFSQRYPNQLSGGQQQRVALARAIAISPEVLVMDEPLTALDAKLRANMQLELKRIQRELEITTLFVTHDQEEALSMSDRIAVLESSRLQQFDTPKRIYQNPANRFVADFMGIMNFIEGSCEPKGEHNVVRLDQYEFQTANAVPQFANPHSGPIVWAIRPENIKFVKDEDSSPSYDVQVEGSIRETRFAGSHQYLYITLDNGPELTMRAEVQALPNNERVTVGWNLDQMLAFPA